MQIANILGGGRASAADDQPALEGGQLNSDANELNTKESFDTLIKASAAEDQDRRSRDGRACGGSRICEGRLHEQAEEGWRSESRRVMWTDLRCRG